QAAQDAIDKLNNLNEAQKEAAKKAVNNATDAAGVKAASDNAETLDGNMGNLKESVADVDATKASVNYTNADEEAQKAYDAVVEAANAIVAKEGTNADSAAVKAALKEVKAAQDALNGDKKLENDKQAAQDAIDKLNNLNEAQKAAAKEAVNKATDAAGVKAASDQATALNGNMGNLKESVADVDATKASGNYKNADEKVQKAYDAAVEAANAIVAKEGTKADSAEVQAALEKVQAAKAALNGDSNLANAKQAAQDAIDKLNNLNDEQKAAAKEAVNNATDVAGVNAASDNAEALDGNMGNLKESVADVDATKASVNYTNADEEAQKAYDAVVEAANAIVAKEGTKADSAEVQAALEKVQAAKAALNGDSNLANAKQAAQDAIDKLNNLNDEQKAAAKAAVDNATDAAGVTAASDNAEALDGNMGNLKESVADVDATKASGNYKNADEKVQKAYDAAVEAANAIVAKEGTKADSAEVQAALEKVQAAKAALNGDSNLANAKQAAQDAIDKLNNLNEAQKAAAKAAIEQASSLAEVSTASDKATNLDSSMGDLKKASIDSESIKNNVEYVNASADKQKAFDDAMKAASDVLNGKQADYKTVLDLIISLSNAKDNLDGAKKFNNSKQVAKVVIDNLANLNDAQKVTAKKEIDSATQENAITTAVNKAKNLDDLMIKLHAAIELAAQTRVTVRYLNASPELREAYDKVVKLSKEVVAKNGNDANANDIQLLLQALETAQNALNGKEIVVTPDSSQSNQTDSNSDNKLENKTANPSKATATAKNKVSTSEKLPQTGDTSDNNVSIIGATLASIAGLFGLGSLYKKKEDK
ncbi:GA module-containing protein, partial [Ligilactobacillus salivarius]|uniref:LPXTG cell wall anchor domain-containing protein n=1 Tax=Ligilactobacillus salivarius TaxID=1624 RepID=UPI00187387E2